MRSENNTWLHVQSGVKLNPGLDDVIADLDPYFARAKLAARVTSGVRSREHQLEIIRRYSILKHIAVEFPDVMTCGLDDRTWYKGQHIYTWQPPWSRLLNLGIIINPPIPAVCLFDYIRNGANRKGHLILSSPHMRGMAFDVGGGADGAEQEYKVITDAFPLVARIRAILLERENNAVHVDVV